MSLDYETKKTVNRWIVEYDFWRMWNEFSKSGTVDDVQMYHTIYEWRGNPHPENFGDRKTHGYRLLMHFMCKIADAANEMSAEKLPSNNQRFVVTASKTTLEQAVDLLGYIMVSNAFTGLDSAEVGQVELCLRRYAVLAALHRGDQTTAKVYRFSCSVNGNTKDIRRCGRDTLNALESGDAMLLNHLPSHPLLQRRSSLIADAASRAMCLSN